MAPQSGRARLVRVLVADDSPQMRRALRCLFATQPDIELVGTAADGREAYVRAAALRPDIVVMDLSMPVLDGVEATHRVVTALPHTRVVVLTSSADRGLLDRARGAGAAGIVLKDVDPAELLAQIRAAAATCGAAR